jgi:DNA-binding MarR family transcriptional regulator
LILEKLNSGPATWSDLLQLTRVKKPTLYQHLTEMKQLGWLKKRDDGLYSITKEGKTALEKRSAEERAEEAVRTLIENLGAIKLKSLKKIPGKQALELGLEFQFEDKDSFDTATRLLTSSPTMVFLLPLLKEPPHEEKKSNK